MNLNKTIIIGNITREIELKALPSGHKVASFSIATNRTWKDNNGAKQEAVEYHNIIAFGKQAEVIAQYCKKGDQLLVEGRLQTRSWEDKETTKKVYRTEIVVESFQFGTKNTSKPTVTDKEDMGIDTDEEIKEPNIDPETGIDCNDIPF